MEAGDGESKEDRELILADTMDGMMEQWRGIIDSSLVEVLKRDDLQRSGTLHNACEYVLSGEGKRLRALFTCSVCRDLAKDERSVAKALVPALSIEILHAASLVHDDLPILDDDDMRRGKPSCHVAFDEPTALLVGNTLQGIAFQVVSTSDVLSSDMQARVLRTLSQSWTSLCIGQHLDVCGATLSPVERQEMIKHKTGALFGAAVTCGAICAGISEHALSLYYDWGVRIGEVFQALDDIADGDLPKKELPRVQVEVEALCNQQASTLDSRLLSGNTKKLVSSLDRKCFT